jgi:hypothetical protein
LKLEVDVDVMVMEISVKHLKENTSWSVSVRITHVDPTATSVVRTSVSTNGGQVSEEMSSLVKDVTAMATAHCVSTMKQLIKGALVSTWLVTTEVEVCVKTAVATLLGTTVNYVLLVIIGHQTFQAQLSA